LKEVYVGLTITALGSILPELTVSLLSALEREHEISIGNVIGDNLITITIVFGLVAAIRPFEVSLHEVVSTVPFMILVTLILLVMIRTRTKVTVSLSLMMLFVAALSLVAQTFLLQTL